MTPLLGVASSCTVVPASTTSWSTVAVTPLPLIRETSTSALSVHAQPVGLVTEATNQVGTGGLTSTCAVPCPLSTNAAGDHTMVEPASMPLRVMEVVSSEQMETLGEMAAWAKELLTVTCPVAAQPPGLEACT